MSDSIDLDGEGLRVRLEIAGENYYLVATRSVIDNGLDFMVATPRREQAGRNKSKDNRRAHLRSVQRTFKEGLKWQQDSITPRAHHIMPHTVIATFARG